MLVDIDDSGARQWGVWPPEEWAHLFDEWPAAMLKQTGDRSWTLHAFGCLCGLTIALDHVDTLDDAIGLLRELGARVIVMTVKKAL